MKKTLFITLSGFFCLFVLNCKNEPKNIVGQLPEIVTTTPQEQPVSKPGYIYGNYFSVQNSSLYENLMAACRRCGTRRFITGPGGTTYQRFWVPKTDPKQCRNWNTEGYIQITFAEKKLPTSATLLIWPKYTGLDSRARAYEWGVPFEITTTARPINENKGFEMALHPKAGLGGLNSMIISSDYSNHVKKVELDITVVYGQQNSQTIIVGRLQSLKENAVKTPPLNCQTYTN